MKIKLLVSLLTIACMLMVAISPLVARNTPYPEKNKDNTSAHPWQDDNLLNEANPILVVSIPVGPIVIAVQLPLNWMSYSVAKTPSSSTQSVTKVRSPKPVSLDKKGESR